MSREPRHPASFDIRKPPDTFIGFRAKLTPNLTPMGRISDATLKAALEESARFRSRSCEWLSPENWLANGGATLPNTVGRNASRKSNRMRGSRRERHAKVLRDPSSDLARYLRPWTIR